MDFLNWFLSVVLHIGTLLFLLIYLPLSLLWKMVAWVFVRAFRKEEDLKGKVVLITGASSGIGEKLAYEYAKRGASMALVARRGKLLNTVAEAARGGGAPDVLVLPADISDADESKRVVMETVAHFGRLDHLVANAGICSGSPFEQITDITAFTKIMDVNFWGSIYPAYYALPHLKASRGKIIVNTSMAARIPVPNTSFYNASKAALMRFYETVRFEFGSEIQITILLPGYVESEMLKGKGLHNDGQVVLNKPGRYVEMGVPVGRAERLAKVVVDRACRGDKYVTWPSWYGPFHIVMSLAPEVVDFFHYLLG
ncbi:11-beta-hydroxysteroid dehydrogenase 1A-like isoform X1 [Typha angustifolia]|uniref:11-beta-hydroxysteroid dehydrogenase 1A-like isoform X1 n=1 Tax=Typha angustifolia TaxID=59011 RepID=UPI003C30A1CB